MGLHFDMSAHFSSFSDVNSEVLALTFYHILGMCIFSGVADRGGQPAGQIGHVVGAAF